MNAAKKLILAAAAALLGSTAASAADTPTFPGGQTAIDQYIATNLQYPPQARENGVEGVVGVLFIVQADGKIGNIKIKRMVDPDLESEAIRLVKKMPAWTPAERNGTPVDAPVELDIPFTLPTD